MLEIGVNQGSAEDLLDLCACQEILLIRKG
jgi:hypothetical protein